MTSPNAKRGELDGDVDKKDLMTRIAELEARLAELEPYRLFVEQLRSQMQREERGRFGDLPFGM